MSKAKKFEDFVNESIGGYPQSSNFNHQIDDYSLSSDPSDRLSNNIKSGVFRMTSIMNDLFRNGTIDSGHESDYSDLEKISEFKILRIFKNDIFLLDIYISFIVDEIEYYGVFKNYGGVRKHEFKSEILTSGEYNKNFLMKLEGILIKAMERFFVPKRGMYTSMGTFIVEDKFGVKHTIKKGKSVKVEKAVSGLDRYIHLEVDIDGEMEAFYIKNLDFYFFNYTFREYKMKDVKKD